jgi:hypothetical protein
MPSRYSIHASGSPLRLSPAIPLLLVTTLAGLTVTSPIGKAAVLEAQYNPSTGNITMNAVDGSGQPLTIPVRSFWFLTNPPRLTGDTANMPAGSDAAFSTTNDQDGIYGVGSEINAANFTQNALFTDTWNLGNVAASGMSLSDITASFTTDPDFTPGGEAIPGGYLYFVVGDTDYSVGTITVVPEPTQIALTAAGLACWLAAGIRQSARRCSKAFK